MKSTLLRMILLTLPLLAAGAAHAAEQDQPFVIADASGNSQRFMPLRPSMPKIDNGLSHTSHTALRSDRTSLSNGFMRIDRGMARPVQTFRATNAGNAVKVIRGTENAKVAAPTGADATIADLFSAGDAPESNFRQARSASGTKVRHSWPLPTATQQHISSGYGQRSDPFTGKPAFHGGVDISAATGTAVMASADGIVQKVEQQGRLGKYVSVLHRDGTESFYGHLSAQNVRVGQRVTQGQKVGEVGSTGRATGPHLDYRIKKGGQTINPMAYLRAPASAMRVASR